VQARLTAEDGSVAPDDGKSLGELEVSSVDLENLVMAHPAVAEAAVIGVPDEKWDERPMVSVVVWEDASLTAAELREFLVGKVPRGTQDTMPLS
jgi:fatty-acyl-CoA synthase